MLLLGSVRSEAPSCRRLPFVCMRLQLGKPTKPTKKSKRVGFCVGAERVTDGCLHKKWRLPSCDKIPYWPLTSTIDPISSSTQAIDFPIGYHENWFVSLRNRKLKRVNCESADPNRLSNVSQVSVVPTHRSPAPDTSVGDGEGCETSLVVFFCFHSFSDCRQRGGGELFLVD